jgi:hypothetical protein
MNRATANLQKGLTVKQAAKLMNVSERMIYMARKVCACAPELGDKILAGEMSMNEAYRLVTNKPKPTSWDRLVRVWNAASEDDHERFIVALHLRLSNLPAPPSTSGSYRPGDGSGSGK